jgi:hypothetical protein
MKWWERLKICINLTLFITFFFSFPTLAEYRVYQYMVETIQKSPDSKGSSIIRSSLDPETFIAYNGGRDLVSVDLLRTWICPGYTGEKREYCQSPYEKLSQEVLSE